MNKNYQLIKQLSLRDGRLALFETENLDRAFVSLLMGIRCRGQISPDDFPKYRYANERIVIAIPISRGSVTIPGSNPVFSAGDEVMVGYWINKHNELFPSITKIDIMSLQGERAFKLSNKDEILNCAVNLISSFYE